MGNGRPFERHLVLRLGVAAARWRIPQVPVLSLISDRSVTSSLALSIGWRRPPIRRSGAYAGVVGSRKAAPQVVLCVELMYRVQLYIGCFEGADGSLDPPLSAWQTGR
jgi:hypothetical protein